MRVSIWLLGILKLQSDPVWVKTSQTEPTADNAKNNFDWVKTPVANLIRYKPSGIFFARVRTRGKLFRQTPKADVISVVKLSQGG